MTGKRLLVAAEALLNAGKQLNVMMECLEEQVGKALTEEPFIVKLDDEECDVIQDDKDWIVKSFIVNIPLYATKRKKYPYAWIGFNIVIYDEEEIAQIDGWEPALYVMYGPGCKDGAWDAGAFDYKADCQLQEPDGRIWLYKEEDKWDSWFFVLPLTALGNEDALQRFVVEPMCKLIKMGVENLDPSQAFPPNPSSPAFRFRMGEEKLEILST